MDTFTDGRRTRLWMKAYRTRPPEGNSNQSSHGHSPRRNIKNNGATGLGFRLRVTVCPKLDQVFLAFSTLLFIASIDLLVLTIVNVGPGLLSRKFQPTKCTIVEKTVNASSYCYISTIENHGRIQRFPCLRIYVTTESDDVIDNKDVMKPEDTRLSTPDSTDNIDPVAPPLRSVSAKTKPLESLLLYENELHLAGGDYLHRPCSFLPSYCTGNLRDIAWQVYNYSINIGDVNSSIDCHYSDSSGLSVPTKRVVMKNRLITYSEILHTILWPFVGLSLSILCCSAFWKHNRHRIPRLFIYNSWSPS